MNTNLHLSFSAFGDLAVKELGTTHNKLKLFAVGCMFVLLAWVLGILEWRASGSLSAAYTSASQLFWPGLVLMAPAIYDLLASCFPKKVHADHADRR